LGTYLERYLAGEHQQVWSDLIALGTLLRSNSSYNDALAVAKETMSRVKYNVGAVVARLKSVNTTSFDDVYEPPETNILTIINEWEADNIYLPMSLRSWYEVVGAIDLVQPSKAFVPYQVVADPLEVFTMEALVISGEFQAKNVQYGGLPFNEWRSLRRVGKASNFFSITIGYDELEKSGSNSTMICIDIPNPQADGMMYYRGGKNIEYFVQYLRRSFEWGGFPGFANVPEELRPTEMLNYLREGLLPI